MRPFGYSAAAVRKVKRLKNSGQSRLGNEACGLGGRQKSFLCKISEELLFYSDVLPLFMQEAIITRCHIHTSRDKYSLQLHHILVVADGSTHSEISLKPRALITVNYGTCMSQYRIKYQ